MHATRSRDALIVNVITTEGYHKKYTIVNCIWVPERFSVGLGTSLIGY
jgi:hypothetical protein